MQKISKVGEATDIITPMWKNSIARLMSILKMDGVKMLPIQVTMVHPGSEPYLTGFQNIVSHTFYGWRTSAYQLPTTLANED